MDPDLERNCRIFAKGLKASMISESNRIVLGYDEVAWNSFKE